MKVRFRFGKMTNSILTPLQRDVLHGLFAAGLGDHGYYLTGGTALAEFYFQHRYSEDLDLFTRKSGFDKKELLLVKKVFDNLGLVVFREAEDSNFARYFVSREEESEKLKVEFCRDAGVRMALPQKKNAVVIDSLEDIGVNKVCTILGRLPSESKDFCDLYFILKKTSFTLDYLLARASEKEAAFDNEEGHLLFALNLRQVDKLERMPRMIYSLTREEMASFLVPQAETIINRLKPKGQT